MEDIDIEESERNGAPKRNGGRDVVNEATDPNESDRRGTALLRLGNDMMDIPLSLAMEEVEV